MAFVHVTDDPAEVAAIIRKTAQGIGLKLRPLLESAD
jgi:hypothetical protein